MSMRGNGEERKGAALFPGNSGNYFIRLQTASA